MKPFISPLAAHRASEAVINGAGSPGCLIFDDGTALAKTDDGFADSEGATITDPELLEGVEAVFTSVSGVEAVSAIIRRLLSGEATLEELSELSGRTPRRVHQIVTALIPAGGWQVNKHKQDAPANKKGRPRLHYSITPLDR